MINLSDGQLEELISHIESLELELAYYNRELRDAGPTTRITVHPYAPYRQPQPGWEYLTNGPCGFQACGQSRQSPIHYV